MQITIIKKNKLSTFILPDTINGNHWITDFENGKKINLLNVEAVEGKWQLISNDDACVVDKNDTMVPYVYLSDYSFFIIRNNYKNEKYYLYCSPVNEKTYKQYNIPENSKVTVGSSNKCSICCSMGGIPAKAYEIEKKKDFNFYLNILDAKASIYINQKRVLKSKRLEYGDIIFIFGLKVVLMRNDGVDYLLVNNPNNTLEYNAAYVNVTPIPNTFTEDYAELSDDSLYSEENYFYRTPYFYRKIETLQVNLDVPPGKKEKEETPAILTIGPMITMSMVSVVSLMSTLNNVSKGSATMSSSMTSLIMAGAMLASALLWPLLTKAFQNLLDIKYERKRQRLYKKYITKKENEINQKLKEQKEILIENTLTVTMCQDVIKEKSVRLWQKRITDEDFLEIPVGIGNYPMFVDIKYPEEHFSMTEDNLLEVARSLGKKPRTLDNVPVTHPFYDSCITGIVGDSIITKEFFDRLALQIMTCYSYDEVKIVTLTSTDNEVDWDYMKVLPHSWSDDKTFRYFGSSNDDYREIIYNLENIYNQRKTQKENKDTKALPQYIIVTDAIKSVDNYDFIKKALVDGHDYGFTFIILVDKITALPNECKTFITVDQDKCTISSSVLNNKTQDFKIDFAPTEDLYECAKLLSNIPINLNTETEASLPDSYEFMEMYQVGKVDQLNISERWRRNNPILSLQAPIGIGKSGEIISLDLHEKYHGPHGLIAGTTGSGKSEFIISYVLSLATNYHPYEVQIILIDYKGGSLAGAFVNDNYKLPHIAGTITNLDGNELQRSLASIESEVKRRQAEFNKARNMTGESTVDIYKYQKLFREGRLEGMAPIAHLFIVSDEFAELKEQQPEFMDKLISVARVGRSLGVHLILATQKPGGVVNDQIWSNSRFKICLKVQDTSDSQEVLKKPDAAYLKRPGRFYLQVGYDEIFTLGQSAWTGAQYFPNNTFKKSADASVNQINNIGFVTTSKDAKPKEVKIESLGEVLPNVVKHIAEVAQKENIKIKKLWLEKIPDKIYIDKLKKKYNFVRKPFFINPIIGEYDDPDTQNQFVLTLPLTKLGNCAVFGIAGAGKEDFIKTVIFSCMTSYAPEEVNFYVCDFGAETLRMFEKSPYVGDVCFLSDEEKINNLFKMVNVEIEKRKELFAPSGGTYESYINSKQGVVPSWVIFINGYEAFMENFDELSDSLVTLTRDCAKYGIHFVLTAVSSSSVRFKLRQNFSMLYALQQNDSSDYSDIIPGSRGKVPAKYKGRGLFKIDRVFEFQTASIVEEDDIKYIRDYCEKVCTATNYRARKVPVLPENVGYDVVSQDLTVPTAPAVGIDTTTLTPVNFNLKKSIINLISSYELENCLTFTNAFLKEIEYMNAYDMIIVNTSEQKLVSTNATVYDSNFNEVFDKIKAYIEPIYDEYEKSGFNNNVLVGKKMLMLVVYGITEFIGKLDQERLKALPALFKKADQIGLFSFTLIDNPDAIKTYTYEDWYKAYSDSTKGVWIGSGITDQNLFRINKYTRDDRQEVPMDIGYVVNNGKLTRVKLLQNFNVKKSD